MGVSVIGILRFVLVSDFGFLNFSWRRDSRMNRGDYEPDR
jgi:hypothetical protein